MCSEKKKRSMCLYFESLSKVLSVFVLVNLDWQHCRQPLLSSFEAVEGQWIQGIWLIGASSPPCPNLRDNSAFIKRKKTEISCSPQLLFPTSSPKTGSLHRLEDTKLWDWLYSLFFFLEVKGCLTWRLQYFRLLFYPTFSACNILHLLSPWQPELLSIILQRFIRHHQLQAPWEIKHLLLTLVLQVEADCCYSQVALETSFSIIFIYTFLKLLRFMCRRSLFSQHQNACETRSCCAPEHLPGHYHQEIRRAK